MGEKACGVSLAHKRRTELIIQIREMSDLGRQFFLNFTLVPNPHNPSDPAGSSSFGCVLWFLRRSCCTRIQKNHAAGCVLSECGVGEPSPGTGNYLTGI